MRKIFSNFAVVLVALLAFNTVDAQNSDNKWLIGVGMHAPDFASGNWEQAQPFNLDRMSVVPPLSRIWVGRNIKGNLNLVLSGSLGNVDYNWYEQAGETRTPQEIHINDELFIDVDLTAQYRLLGNDSWFDPYVLAGIGYMNYAFEGNQLFYGDNASENNWLNLNYGLGFNIWFSEAVGINYQFTRNDAPAGCKDNYNYNHHAAGVVFRFGAKDSDGDGISDKKDSCPDVPGIEEFQGCPDTDADGIQDSEDACPQVAGLAEFNGCADTDGDKIADNKDACPEVAGVAALNGCPDSDGDGVADSKDSCPKVKGLAAFNGCPDTDGDGIQDSKDECPKVAGVKEFKGCPVPADVEVERTIENGIIEFDYAKATIRSVSYETLNRIASIIKENGGSWTVEGHTDSKGSARANQRLSARRAAAVEAYLEGKGVDASNLNSVGKGESELKVSPEVSDEDYQRNRRVEIKRN